MSHRSVINFFATRADLEPGVRKVECERKPQYALCGLFDSPAITSYASLLDVEDLGINLTGDHITGPCYLVAKAFQRIEVRLVPQRRGGIKYAIDQVDNPRSITILPGGIHAGCLLPGQIGTVTEDSEALSLFQEYSRALTKGFKKARGYVIGPDALRLMAEGTRLTTSVRSPAEYDVKL